MAILKNKTQGLYVNVSKDILMDKSLSLRDRGMLVTILSLADNWDFNVKGFSKILPDGVDGIRSSINKLMQRGYLTGGQERNTGGRFGKNVIEVHQIPKPPQLDKPHTEKPFTVEPTTDRSNTEIPYTENPIQVINNKVTNKEANNKRLNNHQSIIHENEGQMERTNAVVPPIPLQELKDQFDYQELQEVLTYAHLMRECREYNLNQFEVMQRASDELKCLIDFEVFVLDGDGAMAEALVEYMAEVIAYNRTITFGEDTYDARSMGTQFYRLDHGVIQYVLQKFDEASQTTKIVNKKNYLLRMLLTAKSDMETGIKGDVNYDMAHWKKEDMDYVSI